MTTAIRSGQVTSDITDAPIPGASIYVYNIDGTQASLTSDGTTPLSQPLTTDQFGNYSYYAVVGYYREDTWYAGKLRFRENNIALGSPGADLALRANLAASGGSSLVDFASGTGTSVVWGGARGSFAIRKDQPTSPPNTGWALAKRGICDGTEAGWTSNPDPTGVVVSYDYITSENGRTRIWAANPIVDVTAGNDATAWGIEINVNNACSVVTDPNGNLKKVGLDLVTGGPNHCTAAARVSANSTNSTGLWNVGYYAERCAAVGFWAGRPGGDTGTQFSTAAFRDNSNSTVGFLIDGGTHTYGIDLVGGTFTAGALRVPNNQGLIGRNAAGSGDVVIAAVNTSNFVVVGPTGAAGVILGANVGIVSSTGLGYATGNGGTVTQATSKSTGVTLNKTCGQITLNNAALAASTIASFTLTNSSIAADDDVRVWIKSGNATPGSYRVAVEGSSAGSRTIILENKTAGSLSESLVLGFNVLKAVVS